MKVKDDNSHNTNKYREKLSIPELYLAFSNSEKFGWKISKICDSTSETGTFSLPIIALYNYKQGPAIWIIAGIHGEEPSGPTMLAHNIEYITKNLKDIPTLIIPLCNPNGYLLNQRYLYYTESKTAGIGVGDPDHVLLNEANEPHKKSATCYEASKLIDYLLIENQRRPPLLVLDLHEDTDISKGYIYSQGVDGQQDTYAKAILKSMEKFVGIAKRGHTRFNENIKDGIIGPVKDISIDEFFAATYIYGGKTISGELYMMRGIGAKTVLTIETPAKNIALEKRILAQQNAMYTAIEIMKNL